MAEHYDPLPDLARLLDAALRAGWSALPYVDRLAESLGLTSADPEVTEKLLREALGLPACRCAIGGTPGVLLFACPAHGTPCGQCGGLEACEDWCGADPAGTVTDLRAQAPATVWRDGSHLVVPALRLDAEGCRLLRTIINRELPELADAEDAGELAPFDSGMHFTESLCPSSLPLAGRSPVPCHLELHHRGPHGSLGEPLQWVGAGEAARAIEAHRSPVIAERRMREALGYDRQAHLAWHDQKYPLRIDRPAEPHNEAATLAAIAEYAGGQVAP